MRERIEEMAVAMTLEPGKPIGQARLEVLRGCDIIEWDASEGRLTYGWIGVGGRCRSCGTRRTSGI
jgi:succinate-semialdehyde dehydrogenase / glutarate-semialdehyde dehydrogenase